jgi:FkbM family methyltransferase
VLNNLVAVAQEPLMSAISSIGKYRATYQNWVHVVCLMRLRRTPIEARLRSGMVMTFHSTVTAYLVALGREVEDLPEADRVILRFVHKGRRLSLRVKGRNWGDVEEVFFRDCYRFIAGPNEIVLDVGASVGDSALYFATEGTKRVIAIEPYPAAYELLLINAAEGGFSNVIEPVNAAVGRAVGSTILDPKSEGLGRLAARRARGNEVPVTTLNQLVERYGIANGVLKMDCEGAEYYALSASDDATLRSFVKMQIEFHYGYEQIEERLRRARFSVSHSPPVRTRNKEAGATMTTGFIYAERL